MPLIDRAEALEILAPYQEPLYNIVTGAWSVYKTEYPESLRVVHSPGIRAGIVHDHAVELAAKFCATDSRARLETVRGLSLLVIEGRLAIRFKKLDDELHSRGQPTQQNKDFRSQLQLDGIAAPHNLEAGYVLDLLGQNIQEVHVVCPNGKGIYWDISLTGSAVVTNVTDMFDRRPPDERPSDIGEKQSDTVIRKKQGGDDEDKP